MNVSQRWLMLVVVLMALLVACSNDDRYAPLPVPDVSGQATTSSTLDGRLDEVNLPGVPGTTSTTAIALGPGPVTLVGRIDGPDGPVAGAIVRVERVVDRRVASVNVPTAEDGTWNVPGILGGHYRVRAWLAPALGMRRAELVFVESPKAKPVILRLERLEGTKVDAAIAPDPPQVATPANLKVRVSNRSVDNEGIVRTTPVAGVSVTLSGPGAWSVSSSNPSFTDSTGSVTFRVECRRSGDQPLSAILDGTQTHQLKIPPCFAPEPTTTTTSTTEVDDE